MMEKNKTKDEPLDHKITVYMPKSTYDRIKENARLNKRKMYAEALWILEQHLYFLKNKERGDKK